MSGEVDDKGYKDGDIDDEEEEDASEKERSQKVNKNWKMRTKRMTKEN